jgi:diaminohydroxyphosphoribosylaminopyrimidine deaminase / 5-amino-6-(5-phosphoribosylamino)uracil reductase
MVTPQTYNLVRSQACSPGIRQLIFTFAAMNALPISSAKISLDEHEAYMRRCLELAGLGAGYTGPNPMVGSVLVYDGRIIGEGYHQVYGQAHAEVNCIASVIREDEKLIPESTLYVSLEPCAHFGKTPPCADLIIAKKIPKVVIGCRDPFESVNGNGIEKLKAAGVDIVLGVLEEECIELNKHFFCYITKNRPYLILKWAQSRNNMLAAQDHSRTLISNEFSNRLVHKWRSAISAILVGTNTALQDDPELTVRLWKGPNPIRMVIDMNLRLPSSLKLFNQEVRSIIFNGIKMETIGLLQYFKLDSSQSILPQLIRASRDLQIQSILVEGGAGLLQSLINEGLWDEARIISNTALDISVGLPAPILVNAKRISEEKLSNDLIRKYTNCGN